MSGPSARSDYLGTMALGHDHRRATDEVSFLALDVWGDSFSLRGVEALPRPSGIMPRLMHSRITSDRGTTHVPQSAGSHGDDHGRSYFDVLFRPELPAPVSRLTVRLRSRSASSRDLHIPVPAWASDVVYLSVEPADPPRRVGPVTSVPSLHPGSLPEVVPVEASVRQADGPSVGLLSIYSWPDLFELHLAAEGVALFELFASEAQEPCWVEDERGNHYSGDIADIVGGGHHSSARAVFAPGLHPEARHLTISFGAWSAERPVRVVISLSRG
jgi:hypothetical protein